MLINRKIGDNYMKLIIQMPCYNEAETLGVALDALPKSVHGFDEVEVLVINDGSSDRTSEVAQEYGVKHIVNFKKNQGLARAFIAGLDACLKLGADVIVNTDADNQYSALDIPKIVAPILQGKADIVIGARPIKEIEHFGAFKKMLQRIGSRVVQFVSKTDVPDAPSGFRAISRAAALSLNVFNQYTYTLETIIQAGQKNMHIVSVPIRTNAYLRPSRLMKTMGSYIRKSVVTMVRIFVVYKPFAFFMTIGAALFGLGTLVGLRYLVLYFGGEGSGHVQSLILASILLGLGFQTILVAFMADLQSVNRKLLEDIQVRVKRNDCAELVQDCAERSHG